MTRSTVVVVAVVAALVPSACSHSAKKAAPTRSTQAAGPVSVYTVAPLTDIVVKVIQAYNYNAGHPGAPLTVTTETQQVIARSVASGKPAVVVLPGAWLKAMSGVSHTGSFGRSLAVIAVPAKNPRHVTDVKAFAAGSGLRTAVCGPSSVFGNLTLLVLRKAGVKPDPHTVGIDCQVKALQRVAAGKLDAALMFRNGLQVPSGVKLLDIAEKQNLIVNLSYGAVGNSAPASQFGTFMASAPARRLLSENGYLP
jgi:ABC-type molybdate transport system substrate-binding protein